MGVCGSGFIAPVHLRLTFLAVVLQFPIGDFPQHESLAWLVSDSFVF